MAKLVDPIAFFSEEDVLRLVPGLTRHQLRYWHRTNFYSPANKRSNPDAGLSLYDFRDLVALRALARFRARIPLQSLREMAEYLRRYSEAPWRNLRMKLVGRELFVEEPGTGLVTSTRPRGQTSIFERIEMENIAAEALADVLRSRRRGPSQRGKIHNLRDVQRNAPVLVGTRIPVSTLKAFAKNGYSETQIKREYPALSLRDIRAALRFEQKKAA